MGRRITIWSVDRGILAGMTPLQKIALRTSEIRQRLNEIAGLDGDGFTDEIRSENDKLIAEFGDLERRHRAAIIAEGETEAAAVGLFADGTADGDSAEMRSLLGRVNLADYLAPAAGGVGLAGAAAELNAALELPTVGKGGGICVPWRMLLPDGGLTPEVRQDGDGLERRVFSTTAQYGGGVTQRPILQRLFGMDIMDTLGVRIDTVPSGLTEWPLITAGAAPDQAVEGAAAAAAAAVTFATETLKPKRLTGVYEYTHEMSAQVPDLEQALRRDLSDAVGSKMNDLIVNGDEDTNADEPDGFATTIDAPDNAAAVATYADYAGAHALAVDGIHAANEGQVSSVVGVDVYQHAASVYQTGSGESGSEALARRGMSCMASPFVGSAANSGQHKLNLFHASGPNGGSMRGDSVAAIWPTLEIIRDIYSKASQGVILTWISLWDAQTAFRSAAYQRLAFDIM